MRQGSLYGGALSLKSNDCQPELFCASAPFTYLASVIYEINKYMYFIIDNVR